MFTILFTVALSIAIPPAAEAVLGDRLLGIPMLRDGYGDALSDGGIARLGSARWRVYQNTQAILFSRDGRRCFPIGNSLQAYDYPSGRRLEMNSANINGTDGQFSADGRYLYVAQPGQSLLFRYDLLRHRGYLINTSNGRESASRGNNQSAYNFSGDGRHALEMALSSNGQRFHFELRHIKLGDRAEAKKIASFDAAQLQFGGTALSATGRYACYVESLEAAGTGEFKTKVHFWDLQSGRSTVLTLPRETAALKAKFVAEGDGLMIRFADKFKLFSNPFREEEGKARLLAEKKLDGSPDEIAVQNNGQFCGEFACEGKRMAYADNGGNMVLAEFPGFKTVWKHRYANSSGLLSSLAFTPDGRKIAFTTQAGRLIRFLDRSNGRELTPPGHTETVQRVVFHPTRPLLVSSGTSSNIRFWTWQPRPARRGDGSPATPEFRQTASHLLEDNESYYGGQNSIQFVRDGNRLVVPTYGDRVFEYDFDGARRFRTRSLWPPGLQLQLGLNSNPDSMIFSPDGGKFIHYDMNSLSASLFNGSAPVVLPFSAPSLSPRRYGFSSDSAIAAFALTPDDVGYVDAKTGQPFAERPGERFRGAQRFLIGMDSSPFDGTFAVRLIDLRTGKPWCERQISQGCYAFTADGRYSATYHTEVRPQIVVREVASGDVVTTFKGRSPTDEFGVQDLEFSPDGKFLASAMEDGTILVWNTDPTAKRYLLRGPADEAGMAALLREPQARLAFAGLGYALAHPAEALAYFRGHYQPAPKADEKRAEELYRQLGEAKFPRRVDAHRQLAALAPLLAEWFDGLGVRKADADVTQWLRSIRRQPLFPRRESDVLFPVRMVECLERMKTPEAKAYLKELARQGDWAALSARMALERLGE